MATIIRSFSGEVVEGMENPKPVEFTVPEAQYQEMTRWASQEGITYEDVRELADFWNAFEADEALNQEAIGAEVGDEAYFELYSQVGE
ncbi:MAG TPA: hypothetical protein VI937_02530 [Negativicutes bacterium]|nr:MAG: hypothetical protein A3C50_01875 [Candidatus Staskawiczbacteria bacterium RIFCSPHIGHO2_02_FULL_43_16]OGZ74449.1 MAG: hypothetical protein A3A12_01615 [Candidatus Staskawiczbacteria bacterium RIFCSPLOWO2_01_FULL_43_17b]HLD70733.1 hypothetical protein [Negativicutes bacterium]